MVNEAVRTRQYREYLDADKHISRQVYNLYQRQENAYNEGTPSIRNQNQLAPISGVVEAVNAFQTELQTLMANTANAFFTAPNFIPTVKTFNALVSALRSIQNIYTKDVQIKYEVDKLLRPVIDLLHSLGSQLAFDPAVSNRLFQMRTNLLSKVYERVDFNVGKRTVIKYEDDNEVKVKTFEPSSKEQDTFQAPVQYDPVSNDPFLGKEALKSEPPATLYGLATDGIELSDKDKAALKEWVEVVNDIQTASPKEFWMDELRMPAETIKSLSKSDVKTAVSDTMIPFVESYDEFPEKIQLLLEKNQFGTQKIKDLSELLTNNLNTLQQSLRQQEQSQKQPRKASTAKQNIQELSETSSRNSSKSNEQPELEGESARNPGGNVLLPRQQPPKTPKKQTQTSAEPSLTLQLSSPPSTPFTPQSSSASSSPSSVPIDKMNDDQLKKLLQSKMGPGVYTSIIQDNKFQGKGWGPRLASVRENYLRNPEETVRHLNSRYNLKISVPEQPSSAKKTQTGLISGVKGAVKSGATALGQMARRAWNADL